LTPKKKKEKDVHWSPKCAQSISDYCCINEREDFSIVTYSSLIFCLSFIKSVFMGSPSS